MISISLLDELHQTPYPRAATALVASLLAVLVDSVLRCREYRALLPSLTVAAGMKFLGTFSLVFLQVTALFYLVTLLPWPLRVPVLLFAVFLVIVQLSYLLTLSQFMTATDLFLALTVSGNHRVEAILSFFKPQVFLYAFPYVLVLSLPVVAPSVTSFRETLALSLLPALYLVASNYLLFRLVPERSFHLHPLTSFLRAALCCRFEYHHTYHGPRDTLPDLSPSQRPLDSLIYVIDESVRVSNLSLNGYPRATTPFLQSLEDRGQLKNLGICVAASSYSHVSNAYLITGHNTFPDSDFRTEKNPTIFDYAKKMGYETLYIDVNQIYLYSLLKAAGDGPVRGLDRWMNDTTFKDRNIDLEITKDLGVARVLSGLLNENSGYFILVNKRGLHFHYRSSYPDDPAASIWKPVMKAAQAIDPQRGRTRKAGQYL